MKILSLDLSYAKTGWSVINIIEGDATIISCGLITSNKDLEPNERIFDLITHLNNIYNIYKPDYVIKEGAIMGMSSTGLNVIKTHGAYEYSLTINEIGFSDVHNATIKAWARNYLIEYHNFSKDDVKNINKKLMVATAIEKYFNKTIPQIWTPKGKLIDDISDSIAMTITAYHKGLL